MCSLEPGSWSATAGADDHRRGRPRCRRGDRRRAHRRRLAARRQSRVLGAPTSAPGCASAKRRRRRPGRAHRVPLREGDDRRRMAGDAGCGPADTAVGARADDRDDELQRRPPPLGHCVTDFAGNVGCLARHADPDRQQPSGPPALARRWPAATAGGGSTTSTSPGRNPDQGPPARSGRLLADHRAGRLRHRGQVRRRPRPHRARRPLACPRRAPTRSSSGCATRPATRRRPRRSRCRCASTTSPPGVAFAAATGRRTLPSRSRRRRTTSTRARPAGEIRYRRLGAEHWTELPTQARRGEPPDTALAGRPRSPRPRRRAPTSSGPRRSTAPATPPRPRARRRHRDGAAQAAAGRGAERRPRATRAEKTRLFARLRWRGTAAAIALTVPFGAAAVLSGRLARADGAGLAGRATAGGLPALARRPRAGRGRDRVAHRASAAASELRLAAGPSRRVAVVFAGRGAGSSRARRPPLALRVRGGVVLDASPAQPEDRPGVRLSGAGPRPRRADPAARQAGRDPVPGGGDRALAPGARHPQRPRRPLPRPLPLPLRQRRRRDPAARRRAAEERWPYAPGSSRPVTVRVSGR